MLGTGLSLAVTQIAQPLKNVRLVILALLANFVLVPLLAYNITRNRFPANACTGCVTHHDAVHPGIGNNRLQRALTAGANANGNARKSAVFASCNGYNCGNSGRCERHFWHVKPMGLPINIYATPNTVNTRTSTPHSTHRFRIECYTATSMEAVSVASRRSTRRRRTWVNQNANTVWGLVGRERSCPPAPPSVGSGR